MAHYLNYLPQRIAHSSIAFKNRVTTSVLKYQTGRVHEGQGSIPRGNIPTEIGVKIKKPRIYIPHF